MTIFTRITFILETETGAWTERAFVIRSRESLHGKMGSPSRIGNLFNAMLGAGWEIVDISEFPNRFTFDFVTGGF